MNASTTPQPPPADPVLRDALAELVALGVRIARVAAAVAEVEDRVVALVAAGLRVGLDQAGSLDEARAAGLAVDAAEAALAQASARIGVAAQAFDRVSRAVRRTVALIQRLDCGWLPRSGSDNQQALVRRQVARTISDRIARQHDGDAAERLFDDLVGRLDALELDGGLDEPAEMVIARICHDLGLGRPAAKPARAGDDPDG